MLEFLFDSLADAAEIGSFAVPFAIFTEPGTSIPFFLLLLFNIGIELLILKKCRAPFAKWILPILAAVSVLACDIGNRVLSDWDRLIPLILYGTFTYNLAVTLLTILVVTIIRRRKSTQEI